MNVFHKMESGSIISRAAEYANSAVEDHLPGQGVLDIKWYGKHNGRDKLYMMGNVSVGPNGEVHHVERYTIMSVKHFGS
jgi:hypothetical protein